jgi:hypothetical protein
MAIYREADKKCKFLCVYHKMADFLVLRANANFYVFTIKWLICSFCEQMQIFIWRYAPIK